MTHQKMGAGEGVALRAVRKVCNKEKDRCSLASTPIVSARPPVPWNQNHVFPPDSKTSAIAFRRKAGLGRSSRETIKVGEWRHGRRLPHVDHKGAARRAEDTMKRNRNLVRAALRPGGRLSVVCASRSAGMIH